MALDADFAGTQRAVRHRSLGLVELCRLGVCDDGQVRRMDFCKQPSKDVSEFADLAVREWKK